MTEFKATIASGTYRVQINENFLYSIDATGERVQTKVGVIINIGGNSKYCVQVKAPLKGFTADLLWLESSTGCRTHTEAKIKGEETINMTHLAITLAKEINPKLTDIILQDSASFDCKLPDGNKWAINMTAHDLVFYQEAYYEKRYGATLMLPDRQARYKRLLKNFNNPNKKPETFSFNNDSIARGLAEAYSTTKTWKEFFDEIRKTYGDTKCQVIYPWVKAALQIIFENDTFLGQDWLIKIRPEQILSYTKEQSAGGRKTRRMRNLVFSSENTPSPPQLAEMDFSRLFKKNIAK